MCYSALSSSADQNTLWESNVVKHTNSFQCNAPLSKSFLGHSRRCEQRFSLFTYAHNYAHTFVIYNDKKLEKA